MSSGGNYVDTVFLRYRAGYKETNAFLAVPSYPTPLPGLVIAHDIFGLDNHIQDVAVRFAKLGYAVLVPDFYSSKGGMGEFGGNGPGSTATFEQRRKLRLNTPDQFAVKDLARGYEFLVDEGYAQRGRVGLLGFGFGGTATTLAAGQTMHFAAAVNFYGDIIYPKSMINRAKPESPLNYVPFIQCPYLAVYGAPEEDISLQDLRTLESTLRAGNKIYEIKTYPNVPNGFVNEARPDVYRAPQATEAMAIATNFLDKYVQGNASTSRFKSASAGRA
jgi:carboxymethylenebutenolidase